MFETLRRPEESPEIKLAKEQMQREEQSNNINSALNFDESFLDQSGNRPDLVKWQQDLDDQRAMLKHELRNEVLTPEGYWKPKRIKKTYRGRNVTITYDCDMPPLINDIGIQMIDNVCAPLLSRNIINTNFNEKRILMMLKDTCDTLTDNLVDNFDTYFDNERNLRENFANLSQIMRIVKNYIIPSPYRALNDGERKHLRTMNKRVEAFHEGGYNETQKKKKVFGLFG